MDEMFNDMMLILRSTDPLAAVLVIVVMVVCAYGFIMAFDNLPGGR